MNCTLNIKGFFYFPMYVIMVMLESIFTLRSCMLHLENKISCMLVLFQVVQPKSFVRRKTWRNLWQNGNSGLT